MNQTEIGKTLGLSRSQVNRHVKAIKKMWREATLEDYGDYVAQQIAVLDAMLTPIWHKAITGDYEAQRQVFKIWDRRNTIMGVDKMGHSFDIASDDNDARLEFIASVESRRVTLEETFARVVRNEKERFESKQGEKAQDQETITLEPENY